MDVAFPRLLVFAMLGVKPFITPKKKNQNDFVVLGVKALLWDLLSI